MSQILLYHVDMVKIILLGPTIWKNIPGEIREVNTCNVFKHKIKRKYFSDIEADENSIYNAN